MENETKITEFIRLLKYNKKLFSDNLGNNPELVTFLKQFISILELYKNHSTIEFIEILKSYKPDKIRPKKIKKVADNIDIQNLSLRDFKELINDTKISKDELLELGEKKLGISKGSNKRLNKDQLRELIESTIRNVETLDVIKQKANE